MPVLASINVTKCWTCVSLAVLDLQEHLNIFFYLNLVVQKYTYISNQTPFCFISEFFWGKSKLKYIENNYFYSLYDIPRFIKVGLKQRKLYRKIFSAEFLFIIGEKKNKGNLMQNFYSWLDWKC